MKDFIDGLLIAAIGAALGILLMVILLQDGIVLQKDEWRCVAHDVGIGRCDMYERLSRDRWYE